MMILHSIVFLLSASSDELNRSHFLTYLDRYCLTSKNTSFTTLSIDNYLSNTSATREQRITPFFALSCMPGWIFHPDEYLATMRTISNLISHHSIDFSIPTNRLAFHYALLNEHMPMLYYALANFCPIDLLHSTIEFRSSRSQNHFSYTLFHVLAVIARLTANNAVRRTLLDSYAKSLGIAVDSPSVSVGDVLAYAKLWCGDEDLTDDPTLLEHLMSLPFMYQILTVYDKETLESSFGTCYSHMLEYRSASKPVHSLKHHLPVESASRSASLL